MRGKSRNAILSLLVVALLVTLALSCGKEEKARVVIKLGSLTDLTGPASPALISFNQGLEDIVKYVNEKEPVSGVEIKLVTYDTQFDPARATTGYEWLRDKGASVISSPIGQLNEILKSFAERDKVPIFCASPSEGQAVPPGWIFTVGLPGYSAIKIVVKWIGEHWSNYPTRPKIAVVATDDAYGKEKEAGVRDYCQAHSDKFEYVGSYFAPSSTMMWSGAMEKVKTADYVCAGMSVGAGLATFAAQFRQKGYTATFFGPDNFEAYRGIVVDMVGYEGMDGTLGVSVNGWWTDSYPVIDLAKELLYENHPGEAEDMIHSGIGYVASINENYFLLKLLKAAIEKAGPEHFDGQAFYDTAINFHFAFEGFPEWGYSESQRYGTIQPAVYEWKAEVGDLVRSSDWLPLE